MKKVKFLFAVSVFSFLLLTQTVNAHCEVPCGIYGDSVRVALIKEHITTVEKSMKMIEKLSNEAKPNYNQIVRWVVNKEEHAKKIQEIVSQYFLHQRIKITDPNDKEKFEKYTNQLTALHEIAVYSMKAKQSTNLENIEKLRKSVEKFEGMYFHSH